MPLPRHLSHADRAYRREKVIAAYQRDGNLRQAAERYGLSYDWARQFAQEAGVWRPQQPKTARRT